MQAQERPVQPHFLLHHTIIDQDLKTPARRYEKLAALPVGMSTPRGTSRNIINVKNPPSLKWNVPGVVDDGYIARTICNLV